MCSVSIRYVLSGDKRGELEEGEDQKDRIRHPFYTIQRINPQVHLWPEHFHSYT
ncbi:unnamed protein product [Staurois parvus]|uniref:Uncharacterized protein n=1 Tax=Staurois parvus TaxID=386267 RepID=A0ABN9BZZ7_9NEOB|nr:unnamed protein product [Staurois parvus]